MDVLKIGELVESGEHYEYSEDLLQGHWLQHLWSHEYVILPREGQAFPAKGKRRYTEAAQAFEHTELSDNENMEKKGWRVLGEKGRLFCRNLGHIKLSTDDMWALIVGLEHALKDVMRGDVGVEARGFSLEPKQGTVTVVTELASHIDMGHIADYIVMPDNYHGIRTAYDI